MSLFSSFCIYRIIYYYLTFTHYLWWTNHLMMTSSNGNITALLAICAGNSPGTQRPVTRSFDVFFGMRLNKRLRKQSWDGDFRRYRAHYDVTLIKHNNKSVWFWINTPISCPVFCMNIQPARWDPRLMPLMQVHANPNSNIHGANMGPIWGRQKPGGPHVGPMKFAIWEGFQSDRSSSQTQLSIYRSIKQLASLPIKGFDDMHASSIHDVADEFSECSGPFCTEVDSDRFAWPNYTVKPAQNGGHFADCILQYRCV